MKTLLIGGGMVNFSAFCVWVYLGRGVATNALWKGLWCCFV